MGCRRVAPQHELVRVVRGDDGLVVSRTGPGRGAWLCDRSPSCLDEAVRKKAFGRALRGPVTTDDVAGLRLALRWGDEEPIRSN